MHAPIVHCLGHYYVRVAPKVECLGHRHYIQKLHKIMASDTGLLDLRELDGLIVSKIHPVNVTYMLLFNRTQQGAQQVHLVIMIRCAIY